jgi:AraC-like DNA-binding protein
LGAHGSSTVLEGDCAPSYLEVLLAPLGAYTLLGLPIDQLSGQIVDLADVLGPAGRRLGDQLRETPSWRRRFALVDEFLLEPKTAARLVRLNRVWRRLDERRPLHWGQVAADAGYADQAHLIRDFHQFTGTTPTQFQARTLLSHGDGEREVKSVQDAVAPVP